MEPRFSVTLHVFTDCHNPLHFTARKSRGTQNLCDWEGGGTLSKVLKIKRKLEQTSPLCTFVQGREQLGETGREWWSSGKLQCSVMKLHSRLPTNCQTSASLGNTVKSLFKN